MRIKEGFLNQFNAGMLSVSMEGCSKHHYDEFFSHILHGEENHSVRFLYGFKFIHRMKKEKHSMIGWMEMPQNKNCIHFSQIWEEEISEVDVDGLFYVFLPGKQTPQVQYASYNKAKDEAERLCKKERQIAYVCEVRVIVELSNGVKFSYR